MNENNIHEVRATSAAFVTCFVNGDTEGVDAMLEDVMSSDNQTAPTDLLYGVAELAAGLARQNIFLEARTRGEHLAEDAINPRAVQALQKLIAALRAGGPGVFE
ncbi:hypothetical protein [Hoyosella altamirensis]|uniref:Uncharacterized protein n=1 Tax=Hoyosella altamirensis TaxID=616997 RepID=A0A839RKN0_9ACTN|nr:hypothetical protein [Hoyosella altamirensis]MBB3037432.1 hypothetical protein [Hoyosella altamirensis]MBB3037449.1 hypothetical protein [Hoyosella altamirensis]